MCHRICCPLRLRFYPLALTVAIPGLSQTIADFDNNRIRKIGTDGAQNLFIVIGS